MNALTMLEKHHTDDAQDWKEIRQAIASDPSIMDGLPVFSGTRIPVYIVLDYLAAGLTT